METTRLKSRKKQFEETKELVSEKMPCKILYLDDEIPNLNAFRLVFEEHYTIKV